MNPASPIRVRRWTPLAHVTIATFIVLLVLLASGPTWFAAEAVERLTTLFIYVILAVMWNLLAGYAGMVSVGQQAFFGLGAYAAIRLASAGIAPYPALLLGAGLVTIAALPIGALMLRLRTGEFAIGMWVVAELVHLLVNLDTLVQGETGTSLIALQEYTSGQRRAYTYWAALAMMASLTGLVFFLLRSRIGSAAQAIRDDETAAASVGVRVMNGKWIMFLISAFGCASAGALWVATSISFQPHTYFSVQWTAYMVFMVLVGGIGTFEGPLLGAVLFFLIETFFGAFGVWYLIGLGACALLFALVLPKGLWGSIRDHFGIQLLPVGYRLDRDDNLSGEP